MLTRKDFTIYPAIDVLEGRVVRLSEGRREAVTVEGGDPVAAAERFAAEGAAWLHLVDLDGAFSGDPDLGLVSRIASVGPPVQVGGGYRSLDSIQDALAGRRRTRTRRHSCARGRVSVGRSGQVRRRGRGGDRRSPRLGDGARLDNVVGAHARGARRRCAAAGIDRVLVTSAQRDGTLSGPDLPLLESVLEAGLPVIAAGGIATLDDLRVLRDLGCEGAVTGSAIWLDRFTLVEALEVCDVK